MNRDGSNGQGFTGFLRRAATAALKSDEERLKELLHARVAPHIATLALRRSQLVRRDPYGNLRTDKWDVELTDFIHLSLFSSDKLTKQLNRTRNAYALIRPYIEEEIRKCGNRPRDAAQIAQLPDGCSPAEFEQRCTTALRRRGWTADVAGASGDQGADVIATKAGVKLVVQCKLYSRPVGNGAVQEVHAARGFYGATKAAVVSNQPFTTSAQQLAARLEVTLVNYAMLAGTEGVL